MTNAPVHSTLLSAVAPFSLGASRRAMSGFQPCAGDQAICPAHVRKAFLRPGSDDEAVVVEVAARPDNAPGVSLLVYASCPLTPVAAAEVERAVARWLGLTDDLRPVLDRSSGDPPTAEVLAAVEGLHQVRFPSLAEGAAYFALSQRSTQWFASARKARMATALGPALEVDGQRHVAFPSLTRLTGLGADGLLEYAGNRQRATRLAEVLDGVAALDEELLRTAPYAQARDALLAVRGVGAFTANAILLRVLGRPDDVPLEMAQFAAVAEGVYGDAPPSPAEIRERYGPYVGWWAYLCRTALAWRRADAKEGVAA
jgi:DNA-3-methyladenine glycosylase II